MKISHARNSRTETPPRARPFQFSLRTLLLAMLAASLIMSFVGWLLDQPPSRHGHGCNLVSESCRDKDVPKFWVETWTAGEEIPVAGHMVRLDTPCNWDDCPVSTLKPRSWLWREYIGDVRIDKPAKRFVLLAGEGTGPLTKIYLDRELAKEWFVESASGWRKIDRFEQCKAFWEKHVAPVLARNKRE